MTSMEHRAFLLSFIGPGKQITEDSCLHIRHINIRDCEIPATKNILFKFHPNRTGPA